MDWLTQIKSFAEAFGVEPPLVMVSIALAVMFRFLRAGFVSFQSGWMYLGTIAASGLIVGTPWFGASGKLPGAQMLLFAGMTLIAQRVLQGMADGVAGISQLPPWLAPIVSVVKVLIPADNSMIPTKKEG